MHSQPQAKLTAHPLTNRHGLAFSNSIYANSLINGFKLKTKGKANRYLYINSATGNKIL